MIIKMFQAIHSWIFVKWLKILLLKKKKKSLDYESTEVQNEISLIGIRLTHFQIRMFLNPIDRNIVIYTIDRFSVGIKK